MLHLEINSEKGQAWVDNNVDYEKWQLIPGSPNHIAVDSRYAYKISMAFEEDGLDEDDLSFRFYTKGEEQ